MIAAEAIPAIEQSAAKEDIADLKADPATTVKRMLPAQLAIAGLIFATLRLS